LHPSEHRPITHWEAARLQTFPDDFKWFGSKVRIAAQIGNAVPPVFAQVIADHVKDHLELFAAKAVKKPNNKQLQIFNSSFPGSLAGVS
jgi:DNA (cytosine-5)-methyltransferase 1